MNVRHQLGTLVFRLAEEEWAARKATGLPEHHVLSADEFPLRHAWSTLQEILDIAGAWRQREPGQRLGALVLSQALVIAGRYEEADAAMADYQALTSDPMGAMRYTGPIPAPQRRLPEVEGRWPRGPAFFVSCDPHYWKHFALPLLRSIAACALGAAVHVHLVAPGADIAVDTAGLPLAVTATVEDPRTFIADSRISASHYYNAVRFVRFAQALAQADGPLCILDADALASRDPLSVLGLDADIALRARAGRFEAVHHFSACLVVASPRALAYFKCVADLIGAALHAPWWGLDQYALHSAYVRTRPKVRFLGPEWADLEQTHDGVFWFTAGAAKATLETDDTPYARLYRRYAHASTA